MCALGIYLLTNTNDAKKQHFRLLVAALALSLCYDVAWVFLRDGAESQLEQVSSWVVTAAQWVQVLLMVFKVVMIFVFWKASHDFAALIDERSIIFN